MKTLVIALIAGALSTTGAFAGEATASSRNVAGNDNTIAAPKLPFRPVQKRPTGARQSAVPEPRVNVGKPQLPFRLYEKRPTGRPNKPSGIEAAIRQ